MTLNILGAAASKIPFVGNALSKRAANATKAAEVNAEAANRALNVNRGVDLNFDARVKTLEALSKLSRQRAIDAKATKNANLLPATQSGAFTLQNYINALQQQEDNQ
jgi:hypothetical protein